MFLLGCATFTEYTPYVEDIDFEFEDKRNRSIGYHVQYKGIHEGGEVLIDPKRENDIGEAIGTILKESSLFREVKGNAIEAETILNVEITSRSKRNYYLDQIAGYTLFLIPSCSEEDLTLVYQFSDKNKKLLKKYNRNIKYSTCVHLTLIPLAPFMNYSFVFYEGIGIVTKSVLSDTKKKGILN